MALYTQRKLSDFSDDWNRIQRQELERQKAAAEEQLAKTRAQAEQSKKPSGLAGILAGIGESIGNVGNTLYEIGGRGIASIADLATGQVGKANSNLSKWQESRKKDIGATSDKDYYLKTAGKALDAASTVSDFIPGLGTAAKVGLNVAQGGISGVGREFAENGENASIQNAVNNAIAGAAGAGAGQAVGLKLGKVAQTPAKGVLGKALRSSIGRGAITGAVGGAVGGGVGTGLAGGNVIQGALQGAEGGALGGAATTAVYDVAGNALNAVKNKIETPRIAQQSDVTTEQDIPDATKRRQTALGWEDQQIDASKRNALQKIGKAFEDTGKQTENADLYGRLNNNTARDAQKNDTISTLKKKYGYTSADYDKAANLSEATNAWIRNEAKTSGASGYDTELVDRVSVDNYNDGELLPLLSDKNAKIYRSKAQQLLQKAKVPGGGIDEYSAAGLYDVSEQAGKLANSYYEKSHNKMDGSVLNQDTAALAEAYRNLKLQTRSAADAMLGGEIDGITRNNLTKMLKNAGAPEEAVRTLSSAKTLSDLKTLTSPLETARNIASQVEQSRLKRGATTDNSTNILNKSLKSAGIGQALDTALTPAGQLVGKLEQGAGKVITGIGDAISADGTGLTNNIARGIKNVTSAATTAPNLDIQTKTGPISIDGIIYDQIIRQSALNGAGQPQATQKAQNIAQALQNAQSNYDIATSNLPAAQQIQPMSAEAQQLDKIKNAMASALAAGDITSYSKLADLYNEAYKIYGGDAATTKLTTAQQNALDEANNSLSMVDQLEAAYNNAGGGQGFISGNLNEFTNWLTGGNANAALNTYNSLKQSLGTSIVKNVVNLGGTEADAQRYLAMLPSATDTQEQAAQKLQELRTMLNNMKANIGSTL